MSHPASPATFHASSQPTRRTILRRTAGVAAGALAAPYIVPSTVLGRNGDTAPNSKVRMGFIGVGGMGTGDMNALLADERVQPMAVCDVDKSHRENARNICKLQPKDSYNDFREVIARDDIDAVMIATPDHWHAIITAAALRSGKDVYCEKPLSLTFEEGQLVHKLVKRYNRVFQLGTWRRSRPACRFACELVRNGYIGELQRVMVGVPEGFAVRGGPFEDKPQTPPADLDYDMWLGPAPWAPYSPGRVHFNFRWLNDYSSGYITDWGAHYMDVAHWGIGVDGSGPVRVSGEATFPKDGLYDAPNHFTIEYAYANGAKAIMFTTSDKSQWGMRFEGTEGWVKTENQSNETQPQSLLKVVLKDSDIHLYRSNDHHRNFIDCVYSRGPTAADIDVAHGSTAACHLGMIAVLLGQDLHWDPKAERFIDNPAAQRMLSRAMRDDWHV